MAPFSKPRDLDYAYDISRPAEFTSANAPEKQATGRRLIHRRRKLLAMILLSPLQLALKIESAAPARELKIPHISIHTRKVGYADEALLRDLTRGMGVVGG